MEARTLGSVRRVSVVCQTCHTRTEFELGNGVPVASCPKCGSRLALRSPGLPQVVSR